MILIDNIDAILIDQQNADTAMVLFIIDAVLELSRSSMIVVVEKDRCVNDNPVYMFIKLVMQP